MRLAAGTLARSVALLAAAGTLPVAAEPARPARAIRVQGNQFVDAADRPVVFRGVAVADPDKLDREGHWNRRAFEEIKAWGANIVRLPVHPMAWRARGERSHLALLDQGVAWARDSGLYVMVDWHVIGNLRTELMQDEMYDSTRKETFEFWRTVARHYRDDPVVVLYELFNEPTDYDGTLGRLIWAEWKPLLEEIVGIVRARSARSPGRRSGRPTGAASPRSTRSS